MTAVDEAPGSTSPSTGVAKHPDEPNSALLGLMPHILRALRREPAVAVTIVYLLVAMAGIFYDRSFYDKFSVPVISLAQLSDFLTAGIQQPMALVLVFSTFPLCWVFDRINRVFRRRHKEDLDRLRAVENPSIAARARILFLRWRVEHLWYTRLTYLLVILAYGWLFVGTYADYRANRVKSGDADEVRVWLNGDAAPLKGSGSDRWSYLGAISNYVFVYDRAAARASIVPVNAIARIEPAAAHSPAEPVVVAPIP